MCYSHEIRISGFIVIRKMGDNISKKEVQWVCSGGCDGLMNLGGVPCCVAVYR